MASKFCFVLILSPGFWGTNHFTMVFLEKSLDGLNMSTKENDF